MALYEILRVISGTKSSQQFHGLDHRALHWNGLGESRWDQIFFCHGKNVAFPHKPILYFWLKKWICCRVLLLVWFSGSGSIGSCCVRAAHAQSQGWGTGGGGFGPRTAGWKPRSTKSKAQLPIYELGGEVGAKIQLSLCRLIFWFVIKSMLPFLLSAVPKKRTPQSSEYQAESFKDLGTRNLRRDKRDL